MVAEIHFLDIQYETAAHTKCFEIQNLEFQRIKGFANLLIRFLRQPYPIQAVVACL